MDKTSEEVMKYLLESISGAKIFLIFTYRPEFVHKWGGRSYHNQVNLNRLSNRESLAMVNYILGMGDIENELENLILEKTEGIPFFIEEFIKSLKDLNQIEKKDGACYLTKGVGDVSIPSTIHDVIMARVDSLSEATKGVLQAGSVIEREFSYDLIYQVTGIPEKELLSHLSSLKDSELLYERGIYPESTYIFKHALTREVVYDSILTKRKKKLHEEIGYAIEKLYIENIKEYYGVLADHFIESDSFEKGVEYSKLASRKAQKESSFNEAIVYGKSGIDCLEKLPRTEEIEKQIIDARVTLGLYYSQMSYPTEAKKIIEPIIELTLERDYKKRIAQIYSILGGYAAAIEGNIAKSVKYLEDSIKIAGEINDFVSLLWSNHMIGHTLVENCEFDRAAFHLDKALEINEIANILWGISIMKCCKADTVYNFWGKVDLGYQLGHEGLQLAEETGEPLAKMEAYCNYGRSCYFKGFLDEAERYLLKGEAITEKLNYSYKIGDANYSLGEIYVDKGEYQKAKDSYNKAISALEYLKYTFFFINIYKTALARAKVMNNEKDIDLKLIYAYEFSKRNEGVSRRYLGEILLNFDDDRLQEADDTIRQAIEADKKNGVMWQLGRDYALYAELFKRKGDQSKARENLNKAIETLKECGADGWVG